MDFARWSVTAVLVSLLVVSLGATAQGTDPPTVSLVGGIDSGVADATWVDPPAAGPAPVVIHFDDEDLTIDAVVDGADSYSWTWDYVLNERGGAHENPPKSQGDEGYYGVIFGPDGTTEDPATIPASSLTVQDSTTPSGWYTYFLTYSATNAHGTTTEYLEVRIVDDALRPSLTVSGHDASTMTLAHPFRLEADAVLPSGNQAPVFVWDGVEGSDSHHVTPGQHGSTVSVTALVLLEDMVLDEDDDPDYSLGRVASAPVDLMLTLDTSPVFTVDVPASADLGDVVEPSLTLEYPAFSDTHRTYTWSIDGDTVAGDQNDPSRLTLTETNFVEGKPLQLTVRVENAVGAGATEVTKTIDLVDTTAPTITITPDRSPDSNGWYNEAVTFTATAVDQGEDLDDDACDAPVEYDGAQGEDRTVTMECEDEAGNVASETFTFNFDDQAPSVSIPLSSWTNGDSVKFNVDGGPSGIDTWSVQYRINDGNNDGNWRSLGSSGDDSEEFDLPTTTEGDQVDFRVKAKDEAGNERAYPDAPDATTTLDKTPPGIPTGLVATPRAGGDFTLSWVAPSVEGAPIKEYVIQHRTSGSFRTLATVSATAHTADLDAEDDSTREFRVAAVDQAGNTGTYTDAVSAVSHNRAPSGTLTVASPTHGGGAALGEEVRFAWTALTAGPGETIEYRYVLSKAASLTLGSNAASTTATSIVFDDVEAGTWYFHLSGVGEAGKVDADPLKVVVVAPVPSDDVAKANKEVEVVLEEVEEDGEAGVRVSWTLPEDPPAPVAGVQVWSVDEDGDLSLLKTLDTDDDEFDDGAYVAKAAGSYVVTMFYEHGEGRHTLDAPPSEDAYETWELETEEFLGKENDSGVSLRAGLLVGGAGVLLAGVGVAGFLLVRSRTRAGSGGSGGDGDGYGGYDGY